MIIELHLLQSFPASNLNRDDLGQPKSVTFGGVSRGRISSQCLKRSARLLFTEHGLDDSEVGMRTKRLLNAAVEILTERDHPREHAEEIVRTALHELGFGLDKQDLTEYLLFVGHRAGQRLAEFCESNWDELDKVVQTRRKAREKEAEAAEKGKKAQTPKIPKIKPDKEEAAEARRILDAGSATDVALFGRMIADNKDFNVDAASQVAHAVSTHAVATEFDFYTAVDDLKPSAEAGADMIGTVDFNAACYYRYANLDLKQLTRNLDGDDDLARRAANAWLRSFIRATPSGKQNSTAARTMPETLLAVARDKGAWNLANAFLKPVTGADLMQSSTKHMLAHFRRLRSFYGDGEIRAVAGASVSGDTDGLDTEETVDTVDDLVHRVLTPAHG